MLNFNFPNYFQIINVFIFVKKPSFPPFVPGFRYLCQFLEYERATLDGFLKIHSQKDRKVNSESLGIEAGTQLIQTLFQFWEAHPISYAGPNEDKFEPQGSWNETRSRIVQTESEMGIKLRQNRKSK